ncbi:MAG: hypothetical protein LEGION0403_FIIPPAGN_02565 [Legionella sp.]|jgi:hypothetical protein|nr:hypothetical protein [Legionella rowbothamii]
MMKWIVLLGVVVFMSGCCCTQVVAYRQVAVTPVVEPVMVFPYRQGPIDVTTTTIDYY